MKIVPFRSERAVRIATQKIRLEPLHGAQLDSAGCGDVTLNFRSGTAATSVSIPLFLQLDAMHTMVCWCCFFSPRPHASTRIRANENQNTKSERN